MVEGGHKEVIQTSLLLLRWCWYSLPSLISFLHAWTFYEERLELTLLLLSYNLRHSLFWFTVSLSVLHVVYLSRVTGSPKYKQPIRILSDTINQSTSQTFKRALAFVTLALVPAVLWVVTQRSSSVDRCVTTQRMFVKQILLSVRRWSRFARRNGCDSATEIPHWWRKSMFT